MIATLEDLDEAALVKILTEPKNALVKQYQRLFEMENVGLTFTEDALHARRRARPSPARPARAACARSWKASCWRPCSSCPTYEGVEEVVVNAEVVEGRANPPLVIYAEKKGGAGFGA